MAKRDYYEVLGVEKNAAEADLKKAYRRMAMKYHPDRNQDNKEAEASFKEAKEAYEILSDKKKRTTYDQFGHAGVEGSFRAGGPGGAGFNPSDIFGDIFGDVFGDIFGGGRRGGRSQVYRGSDLRYELELSLEQAVVGDEVEIHYQRFAECDICDGSGEEKGGRGREKCDTCGGHGQVRMQQGFFSIQQTCPRCQGTGSILRDPCEACHGSGRREQTRNISVKIPPGVDDGDRIRLTGEGEPGHNGGPSGNLFVDIRLKPHSIFQRDGSDLHCRIPVGFTTAALGGDIEIPSLNGRVTLKIPQETQSGKIFRLRGKGVRTVRGSVTGDLFCEVDVETPVNLSREQKDLLRQFENSVGKGGKRHSPRHSSWLDGVKQFFENLSS
ncbi:MAG: molecular chaperone DnaJ [Gammaproteobacteria bacterium]